MTRWSSSDAVRVLCLGLEGREVDRFAARLDDASVLRVPGLSGLGGDYQGSDAIVGLLRSMAAATDRTLRFEVGRSLMSRPDILCVEGRLSGTRVGRPLSATITVDAVLADQVFLSITIECADRSAWDAMWKRAGP